MAARQRESVSLLKQKIEELEKQVADYKKRLDDLRKAKNTTILKREREVLEVGGPNLGKKDANNSRVAELEKKLEECERRRKEESASLQRQLESQVEALRVKDSQQPPETSCGHEGLIQALQADNQEMRDRIDSLHQQLSIKEAEWCEAEEQLKLKMKQSWGEKYAEWMAATEQKMEELQHTNNLLRQMLNPRGTSDGAS